MNEINKILALEIILRNRYTIAHTSLATIKLANIDCPLTKCIHMQMRVILYNMTWLYWQKKHTSCLILFMHVCALLDRLLLFVRVRYYAARIGVCMHATMRSTRLQAAPSQKAMHAARLSAWTLSSPLQHCGYLKRLFTRRSRLSLR